MKTKLSLIICSMLLLASLLSSTSSSAQTVVRLPFTKVTSTPNTGMDFTPWLNDDVTDLVQNVWGPGTQVWANLKLPLAQHSIIKRLSFYDMEGTFSDKPDSIYALNGNVKTLIGTFTGPQYMSWDGFTLAKPVEADAIIIRKFGNNIPQKVQIFGYADVSPAQNANLAQLGLSTGTVSPTFNPLVQIYKTEVANSVTSIKVIPTVAVTGATIKVNGKTVISGQSSLSIPLTVGTDTISVVVTATDKVTTRPYTVVVTRDPSANDILTNLVITKVTLSPAFKTSTLAYTDTVANSVTYVNVTPTAADATSVIKVNGIIVASGGTSPIVALLPGLNVIKTLVTAEDKKTSQTYTTTIYRTPLLTATLANLVISSGNLNPVFNTGVTRYNIKVSNSTTSITVVPTSNGGAGITVNSLPVASGKVSQTLPLNVGPNIIRIRVTAQDDTTINRYILDVIRVSTNANLNNLTIANAKLAPTFAAGTLTYKATVGSNLTSLKVTPMPSDTNSTVKVNGTVVGPNATITVPIATGATTMVNTQVTAQDGVTVNNYAVAVTQSSTDTTTTPPDTTGTTPPPDTTGGIVKIPIDPSRFYVMNNASNGLQGLFDGILTVGVNTGYGELFSSYDCYYPLVPGEAIDLRQIKYYSYQGGLATPMTVDVIDTAGIRTNISSYIGGVYQQWIGPYPGVSGFNLKKPVKGIKYIVLHCTSGFPNEMEFYGYYTAPPDTTPIVRKPILLNQYFGTNAFEWNLEDPNNPLVVSTTMLTAMRAFTQIRHYMDWGKIEPVQGHYCYDPILSGGWNYDALYTACKTNNMLVLADIKTQPLWMQASWPSAIANDENVPVMYGKDFNDPNSYIEQAHVAFEYAARYGSNASVSSSLLSVDPTLLWTGEPINVVKKGLGLVSYIECDNERDKWWKGTNAYQNCYQYAANLSAFYDGNKNTMGPGVGVKNADPNMKVVIGGLCSGDPTYVHGMVQWCIEHRGYKADGTVNLCWDVINYHFYSNDGVSGGNASVGVAPELSSTMSLAQGYLKMAHQYANDQEVWVTEAGYDFNPGSPQRAPAIGGKTAQQVEGDWILRTSLLYARAGISRVFFYEAQDDDPNISIQYASSGLLNSNQTRRPAADYLYQTNKLFGNYNYVKTINSSPIVDNYQDAGQQMYMLVMPTQTGKTTTYSLNMGSADSAYVYNPVAGANDMAVNKVKLTNGSLSVNVTETPTFIVPSGSTALTLNTVKTANALVANSAVSLNTINVYPNPTAKMATVAFTNTSTSPVTIKVTDVNMNKTYKTYNFAKNGNSFSNTIDVSNVPMGVCIIQVLQGDQSVMRKVIKTM